jgi:hypothetical protein
MEILLLHTEISTFPKQVHSSNAPQIGRYGARTLISVRAIREPIRIRREAWLGGWMDFS